MLACCPLIAFGLIRLDKLECIRDVSTSKQNSQELQICGSTSLAPGSHQSCGMFGIAGALKLRNDDSVREKCQSVQCREDHQSVDLLAADIYGR